MSSYLVRYLSLTKGMSSPGSMVSSGCVWMRLCMASISNLGWSNGVGAQFATKSIGGSVGTSSRPSGRKTVSVSFPYVLLELGAPYPVDGLLLIQCHPVLDSSLQGYVVQVWMFTSSALLYSLPSESLVTLGFPLPCSACSAMLLRLSLIICSGSSTCTSVLSALLLVTLCIRQLSS